MAPDIEQYLREVVRRWGLVIYEQSKSVTGSDDVFVTFVYFDDLSFASDRWTMIVRNYDFGTDDDPGSRANLFSMTSDGRWTV